MKVKSVFLTTGVVKQDDIFLLCDVEDWFEWDKDSKKTTDNVKGSTYTVMFSNKSYDISWEKLEVKVPGMRTIDYKKDDADMLCKFKNLELNIKEMIYLKGANYAVLQGNADRIDKVSEQEEQEQPIKRTN